MRACAYNARAARLVGIAASRMVQLSFGVSAALGAGAGILIAPLTLGVYDMGTMLGLVEAQHTAAILTTFNEVNMQPVMDLRSRYREAFEREHKIKLGFMSFFVKASVEALKRFPEVNASIEGTDIIYHGYHDIGIAVSSPRGLVVPILRDADRLDMAAIESRIKEYSDKAQAGTLALADITGGTFTITNGGIFGSLVSTPILNPPQSAILGMHKIQDRPIAENGTVVIRPMMYLALSYDHRLVDGREAVRFLVTVKEMIEDPARLLLGV